MSLALNVGVSVFFYSHPLNCEYATLKKMRKEYNLNFNKGENLRKIVLAVCKGIIYCFQSKKFSKFNQNAFTEQQGHKQIIPKQTNSRLVASEGRNNFGRQAE